MQVPTYTGTGITIQNAADPSAVQYGDPTPTVQATTADQPVTDAAAAAQQQASAL